MDQVSIFLLTVAGVFLVGVLGELIFQRTQVPDAVWLVAVGILLGPVTGLLRHERLEDIAPFFAALTLIVILFDGGRHLRGRELRRSALPAIGLALLAFGLSCAAVAVLAQGGAAVGWLPQPWAL
jgi:cell volume regulation protein A